MILRTICFQNTFLKVNFVFSNLGQIDRHSDTFEQLGCSNDSCTFVFGGKGAFELLPKDARV